MENNNQDKKVVIVTGSSSGIGLALCNKLVDSGYIVYGLDKTEYQDKFHSMVCDLTDYNKVAECYEKIYSEQGKIDILVSNAGMGISGAVEHISMDMNKKLFDVNMMATINATKLIIPYFKKCGGGKIVCTSSIAGIIPLPFQTAYSMSKAAINSFVMSLGIELKPLNIKVCAVMPGDAKTGFTSAREKQENSAGYDNRLNRSVEKMEHDETHGLSAEQVANVLFRQIKRKNPPVIVSMGAYKWVSFLQKILPRKWMLKIVAKIYG